MCIKTKKFFGQKQLNYNVKYFFAVQYSCDAGKLSLFAIKIVNLDALVFMIYDQTGANCLIIVLSRWA